MSRKEGNPKHGLRYTRAYKAFHQAKQRCTNPNTPQWRDYGGRGIQVEWESFEKFYAVMGECPEGMSLDRFPDTNGNYVEGNCRWATRTEQNRNQRSTLLSERKAQLIRAMWVAKNPNVLGQQFFEVVAPSFGCSPRMIKKVVYGHAWKNC